jgi:hypothetical protein
MLARGSVFRSTAFSAGRCFRSSTAATAAKPTLWDKVVHMGKKYYTGFKLVFENRTYAAQLQEASRTRQQQLDYAQLKFIETNKRDLAKLVPIGLLVALLPEALPAVLWAFPNALPSTIETVDEKTKRRQAMRHRWTIASVHLLQEKQTLDFWKPVCSCLCMACPFGYALLVLLHSSYLGNARQRALRVGAVVEQCRL